MMNMAKLFMDQCIGEYSGHMSMIPYNPTLRSIFTACGIDSCDSKEKQKQFVEVLRKFADSLDE